MKQSRVQRLSWFQYIFAALLSYLTLWLAAFLEDFLWHRILLHPVNRFILDQSHFPTSIWLMLIFPAAINFLILLPFLRFPVLRWIAFVCLCIGWVFLFWFFQARNIISPAGG